jgi:hypothetical protein
MGTRTYGNPRQSALYRKVETSWAENCNVYIKRQKFVWLKKCCFYKTAVQQMSANVLSYVPTFTVTRTVSNRCLDWDPFTWDVILCHWVICVWCFETTTLPPYVRHQSSSDTAPHHRTMVPSNGTAAKAKKLTSISRLFSAKTYEQKWTLTRWDKSFLTHTLKVN